MKNVFFRNFQNNSSNHIEKPFTGDIVKVVKMEEDDFINIRPPQAKSEDKSHRPRISSSKRDRQVFVSSGRRGDERSQNRQYFI